jgi:hypothetical protein
MKKYYILLFFFVFLIYKLNFSFYYPLGAVDTIANRILPFNILSGEGLYVDNFQPYLAQQYGQEGFLKTFEQTLYSCFSDNARLVGDSRIFTRFSIHEAGWDRQHL